MSRLGDLFESELAAADAECDRRENETLSRGARENGLSIEPLTRERAESILAVVDAINRDGRRPDHVRVHSSRFDAWRRIYFWRFSFAHKLATSLGWGTR